MLITLTLLAALISLFYLFLIWNFKYWSNRGVRSPKPKPFVGNYPHALSLKQHVANDLDDLYRAYKHEEDFVGIYSFRSPQLLVLSPTLCHSVFVNDFKHFHDNEFSTMITKESDFIMGNNPITLTDEEWKDKRALLIAGLKLGKIKTVYSVTNKVCKKLTQFIEQQIKIGSKDGIDAKDFCLRFTSDVVSDCVFGIDAGSLSGKPSPILTMTKRIFEPSIMAIFYATVISLLPRLKKIYKPRIVPKDVGDFFINLMQEAINLRKSQPEQKDRVDFLNYMLQLQEKNNLTVKEITANTMTFLLDGFETTSIAISHCLLLLGRNLEAQERLRTEILENIDENGVIEFEKLGELPYLDACVHEALRIFPPALFSNKLCTESIVLTSKSGRSVKIEKGQVVVLPLYSFMNDEEYYPNPHEFQPERFLEENGSIKDYREKGIYLAFGDGPRMCIGMRFALTQYKAAIVEFLQHFKIQINPKTRKDNFLDPKCFLTHLDGGIWLNIEKIN